MTQLSRRQLMAGAAAGAGMVALPAVLRAQSRPIILGHLIPRTGFLGPIGEYGVMAIDLAVEEINAAGGIKGRYIELVKEDSINPQTATTKAERMFERDNVVAIIGEISSASALTISQAAQRVNRIFINTGANSDTLRGQDCKRTMFHTESQNTIYVNAEGEYLLSQNMVKGKSWFALSADYVFGHDLRKAALSFLDRNGGRTVGDDLIPVDASDFSSYLLKIRTAKPDLVALNLAGTQITNFCKQFGEFGLDIPIGGFGYDTVLAWAAGPGNFQGTWPTVWTHQVQTDGSQAFVQRFMKKYNKMPENQAWSDYVAVHILAQAIAETGGTDTDTLIDFLESGAEFDILKHRKGHFNKDHQLLGEMYTVTGLEAAQIKNQWDVFTTSDPVPGPDQALEVLTQDAVGGTCTFA